MGRFISVVIPLVVIGCSSASGTGPSDDDGEDAGGGDDVMEVLTVDSTLPTPDETGVEPQAAIIIDFSHAVREETVTPSSFVVTGPLGAVPGSYLVDGDIVTFVADAPHHLLGGYDVLLTDEIGSDEADNLASPYELSFRVEDGDWSNRIDLAEQVGGFLGVARNRRGDILLPFTTSSEPTSIKAVRFDAEQRTFTLPEVIEEASEPFGDARGAISESGDAIVVWSSVSAPQNRGWVRRTTGAWGEETIGPGSVGRLGLTADGTAIMASVADPGPETVFETLAADAAAWSSPQTAVAGATLHGVMQSGDRVEIIAHVEADQQLVARGYAQGSLSGQQQQLSPAGTATDAVNLQYLPGEDLVVSWVQDQSQLWYARFDAAGDTWMPRMLAGGVLGSAVCANEAGAQLAAFISGGQIFAVHAAPGDDFAQPQNLGSPAGMEYARCAIDELGNGVLIWARAGGKSFEARFADGAFTQAAELGDGPTVIEAVAEPGTGRVRVIFYNSVKLTARVFE